MTAEQKAKKAVADAVRYRRSRLTVEQKAENVRIETETETECGKFTSRTRSIT